MLAFLLILSLLLHGLDNAEKLSGPVSWPRIFRAHPVQVAQNAVIFFTGVAAGYGWLESIGIMFIGDALFQIPINLRYGWRAFDKREGKSWPLLGFNVPKFYGLWRVLEIVIGGLLLWRGDRIGAFIMASFARLTDF